MLKNINNYFKLFYIVNVIASEEHPLIIDFDGFMYKVFPAEYLKRCVKACRAKENLYSFKVYLCSTFYNFYLR
jgi:hypothetical protein